MLLEHVYTAKTAESKMKKQTALEQASADSKGRCRLWLKQRAKHEKVHDSIKRKLDLVTHFKKTKMAMLTIMAVLSAEQRRRIERLSSVRKNELMNSDFNSESEHDTEIELAISDLMVKTDTAVDRRIDAITKVSREKMPL